MEAIFVPPDRLITTINGGKTADRQSFRSFSDNSEKAFQTDMKTDASSCTFPDNKKQPTCFATAESPPTEQDFIIVFALLKSLQVVKTHDIVKSSLFCSTRLHYLIKNTL